MSDASARMVAAKGGDIASLQQLLVDLQRSLRVMAALFLPSMRAVDAVVQRLGPVVVESLDTAPVDDPVSWLHRQLRTLIGQHLDELERRPAFAGDPLGRMLLSAGRERLGQVPLDVDPVSALKSRLPLMTKGALDLLTLRFTNQLPLTQIASQRLLSIDDVTNGIQTACRQIDWLNGASGGDALEAQDYRALDQLVCGGETTSEELSFLRARMLDDMALALRVTFAARVHMAAAAWFAPALTIELRSMGRTSGTHASGRRRSNPAVTSRIKKNRGFSTPTRRQLALRGDSGSYAINRQAERQARYGLIATLIGGALVVVVGAMLLLLRDNHKEIRDTKPAGVTNTQPVPQVLPPPPPPPPPPSQAQAPVSSPPMAPNTTPSSIEASEPLFTPAITPAPVAVWSTRLLVSGYRGPLMRVRRSNDNAEQEVGALVDGSLDTATLTSFTGEHSAHVVAWYDQTVNQHHLLQQDNTKQPRIITKGVMDVDNTRPVISFDRNRSEHFITPAPITLGCLYAVVKVRPYGDGAQALFGSLSNQKKVLENYYPIVDRSQSGQAEWWLGGITKNKIKAPIARDRLLIWHSSIAGTTNTVLTLHLDGKMVGTKSYGGQTIPPRGPTVVGGTYWDNAFADPFGGTLGEMFVLPPGSSDNLREIIYQNVKTWWKTP